MGSRNFFLCFLLLFSLLKSGLAIDCSDNSCLCDVTTCDFQCGNQIDEGIFFIQNVNSTTCLSYSLTCFEFCDNGKYNGYVSPNGTCCNNYCSPSNRILTSQTCVVNGDCDDADNRTLDYCVGGWCKFEPMTNVLPCENTTNCAEFPCFNVRCGATDSCVYQGYTGTPRDFDCRDEDSCFHTLQCSSGRVVAQSPTLQVQNLVPDGDLVNVRCDKQYSFAQYLWPAFTNESPLFGPPSYSVLYSLNSSNYNCSYDLEIIDNDYFQWNFIDTVLTNSSSICVVDVTYLTDCGQTAHVQLPFYVSCCGDYTVDLPMEQCEECCKCKVNLIDVSPCVHDDDCSIYPILPANHSFAGNEAEFFDPECVCGFCAYRPHQYTFDTAPPDVEASPSYWCPDYPCWSSIYDAENGTCTFAINDEDADLYCQGYEICYHNLKCDNGTVVGDPVTFEIVPFATGLPPMRCNGNLNLATAFDIRWFGIQNHSTPGSSWFVEQTTPCPLSFSIQSDIILHASPSWDFNAPSSTCELAITHQSECGQTQLLIVNVVVGCCGDGIVQEGFEQCDLGSDNNAFGTCCDNNCLFQSSSILCRAIDGDCDIPEFCTSNHSHCPPDQLFAAGHVCALGSTECTSTAWCNGYDRHCPSTLMVEGYPCKEYLPCQINTCDAHGICVFREEVNFDDGKWCNGRETCVNGTLVRVDVPNCDDSNSCTNDACSDRFRTCLYTYPEGTFGSCGSDVGVCQSGTLSCDGTGPTPVMSCVGEITPVPEICSNGLDDNCNGYVDEGCNLGAGPSCNTDLDCENALSYNRFCQTAHCNIGINRCYILDIISGQPCLNEFDLCFLGDECNGFGTCMSGPVSRCTGGPNPCKLGSCISSTGECVYECAHSDTAIPSLGCETHYCGENSCQIDLNYVDYDCRVHENPCEQRTCLNDVCVSTNISGPCNDGNPLTTGDYCSNGLCDGIPVSCTDNFWCTVDTYTELGCISEISDGTCLIDGVCYGNDDQSPFSSCFSCLSFESRIEWSFNANHSCDDGLVYTENDRCDENSLTCQGTPVDLSSLNTPCALAVHDPFGLEAVYIPVNEGLPCDDGRISTIHDRCRQGHCVGELKVCQKETECQFQQYIWQIDQCVWINKPDWTLCYREDSSPCLGQSRCNSGHCDLGFPVSCPPSTQCSHSYCDPVNGGCVIEYVPGTPCDHSDRCVSDAICNVYGDCVPSDEIPTPPCNDYDLSTADYCDPVRGCENFPVERANQPCVSDLECPGLPCYTATCDLNANTCQYRAVPAGTSCGNGNVCDGEEVCAGNGVCLLGTPLDCHLQEPCAYGTCHPQDGCLRVLLTNETEGPGDDIDVCNKNEHCIDGVLHLEPKPPVQFAPCLQFVCVPYQDTQQSTVVPMPAGTPCDDGSALTYDDQCDNIGNCFGTPIVCPDPGTCDISVTWDSSSETCVFVHKIAGASCAGFGTACGTGACDGLGNCLLDDITAVCNAIDQCHAPGECDLVTGICSTPLLPDGSFCNHTDTCVTSASCVQGQCVPETYMHCYLNHSDPCIAFHCENGTCLEDFLPAFTPCDNHDLCKKRSFCDGFGSCISEETITYESTECVNVFCDPALGRQEQYLSGPCNTGNLCQPNGICEGGICVPTADFFPCPDGEFSCGNSQCMPAYGCIQPTNASLCPVCIIDTDCPNIPCKQGFCDLSGFCVYSPNDANIIGCVDENWCNGQEQCYNGTCVTGLAPSCDDRNPCTNDGCNDRAGVCTHDPINNTEVYYAHESNFCILRQSCDALGQLIVHKEVECPFPPQCMNAGECNPLTGSCDYTPVRDGTCCKSSNPCIEKAVCIQGTCTDEVPYPTPAPVSQCFSLPVCDVLTGEFVSYPLEIGTPCDDGQFCTSGDQCDGMGRCSGNLTLFRNSMHSPCSYEICDEVMQTYRLFNVSDYTPCDTGATRDVCSGTGDVCLQGECKRQYSSSEKVCRPARDRECDVPEFCTGCNDACPLDSYQLNDSPCQLNNSLCMTGRCAMGSCSFGFPIEPQRVSPCMNLVCDPILGVREVPLPTDYPCSTLGIDEEYPQCVNYQSCDGRGQCVDRFAPVTKACNPLNKCILDAHCSGVDGECVSTEYKTCEEWDTSCARGRCDEQSGACVRDPIHEGQSCNADNDQCTTPDECFQGTCLPGPPLDCSFLDGDCLIGECLEGGCVRVPANETCNPNFCSGGCALPYEYWVTHSVFCESNHFHPWPMGAEENQLCGHTWFQWMQKHQRGNAFTKLAHQWITASLNSMMGTCIPPVLAEPLDSAQVLLETCKIEVRTSNVHATNYADLTALLLSYNQGTIGPGNCFADICYQLEDDEDDFMEEFCHNGFDRLWTAPMDCDHGIWNRHTGTCECFYGWTGADCDRCNTQPPVGYEFLCVPSEFTWNDMHYILRAIPSDSVEEYIHMALPFLINNPYPVVRPDTHNLDCSCQPVVEPDDDSQSEESPERCEALDFALTLCEESCVGHDPVPLPEDDDDDETHERKEHRCKDENCGLKQHNRHSRKRNAIDYHAAFIVMSIFFVVTFMGALILAYNYWTLSSSLNSTPISKNIRKNNSSHPSIQIGIPSSKSKLRYE